MADLAYICLRRNDIPQGSLQITDLKPNTSQRNLIYDGVGQTGYVLPSHTPQNAAITALVPGDPDGGGGNDHLVTGVAEYGLQAYLRDRVNVNPGVLDRSMTVAEALACANAIVDRMSAGQSLLLADINVILNANCAGADNDLEGTAGTSFGTVIDILSILAGQVYEVRANTVIELLAGPVWRSLAQRVAAIATNTANFFSSGAFVAATATTFRDFRTYYRTGALNISLGEGVLSTLIDPLWVWLNPSFYYTNVVAGRQRALTLRTTAQDIPATGAAAAIVLYDDLGNVLT